MRRSRQYAVFSVAALLLAAASVRWDVSARTPQSASQNNAANNQEKHQPDKNKAEQNKKTNSQDNSTRNSARTQTPGKAAAKNETSPATESSKRPASPTTGQALRVNNGGNTLVWVNTQTKIYHLPGSRWYGKTKHGKYMLESDARRAGYHPAGKK